MTFSNLELNIPFVNKCIYTLLAISLEPLQRFFFSGLVYNFSRLYFVLELKIHTNSDLMMTWIIEDGWSVSIYYRLKKTWPKFKCWVSHHFKELYICMIQKVLKSPCCYQYMRIDCDDMWPWYGHLKIAAKNSKSKTGN